MESWVGTYIQPLVATTTSFLLFVKSMGTTKLAFCRGYDAPTLSRNLTNGSRKCKHGTHYHPRLCLPYYDLQPLSRRYDISVRWDTLDSFVNWALIITKCTQLGNWTIQRFPVVLTFSMNLYSYQTWLEIVAAKTKCTIFFTY